MDRVQVTQPAHRLTGWVDQTRQFMIAVRDEMKKVTWPTRDELVKATRMIVILSILLGVTIAMFWYQHLAPALAHLFAVLFSGAVAWYRVRRQPTEPEGEAFHPQAAENA